MGKLLVDLSAGLILVNLEGASPCVFQLGACSCYHYLTGAFG